MDTGSGLARWEGDVMADMRRRPSRHVGTGTEASRRHIEQTSKAMRNMTRRCDECGRGQNPRVVYEPPLDEKPWWACRYCGHVNV